MVRVLLSQDNADVREMYGFALTARGFDVDHAPDAAAVLTRLERSSYDVVVVDGGPRNYAQITATRAATDGCPLVVLSTYATAVDRAASLEAGADDYIASPVDLNELAGRLRAVTEPLAA